MKKPALLLTVFALCAASSFAQNFQGPTSEFGITIGGTSRLKGSNDDNEANQQLTNTGFSFDNSVREVYYSIALEPDTRLKIKAGQIEAPLSFYIAPPNGTQQTPETIVRHNYPNGRIQHVDGLIDYRFTEPFGSTGIFAGAGLYRQQHAGETDESAYGFSGGVNGDFPINRRFGFIVEATYHKVFFDYKATLVTLSGGFRISF